ncbi:Membrane transport protein [Campylobacter hyointestinalis]|uniref:Membrane transport protein n=1 Tax=Campylobacter hyointestinalis subsp. hyointestinalis TaxID=91352 RepID=A0A9W5AUX3_CAMHY|nr:transporter [Campylobacter hyointestinalis]PPB51335.1 transporter [Campylobacter hyointestinalis subsp. hyointestinalis]PPB61368.1 transporter [Campylobacter hyointestinalis subsp. hyointestinalis]PPB65890.1 transporter [Campylobacter hyointestinalis subsp. hyointestinalis]PPB68814.1 transporter [Campylobacter hyointestinalis subsp. hyointestinalis]PPB72763.1 transporter [Campylobacter hyointestinalis subsp. hyointestinalis]
MNEFFTLLGSIIPLYICIFLGFISTAVLKCSRETVAKILLFILSPLVVFNSAMSVKFNASIAMIPITLYCISIFIAFSSLPIFKRIFSDNSANLLSFSVATGNSAYLGIPIALLLLSDELVEIFIFSTLGAVFYQNTAGYFITAKGNSSVKQSLIKVAKLPVIYAFLLGITLNKFGVTMPEMFSNVFGYTKGALAILGMMIVGMGMEKIIQEKGFDLKFVSISIFVKFIIWPTLICILIFLDAKFFGFFDKNLYIIFFILSIVPLAGNTVTIAALLNVWPAKMLVAVFISTLISLFSIPAMLYFYSYFEKFLFKI